MIRVTKEMVQNAFDETERKWRYLASEDVNWTPSCGFCQLNSRIIHSLTPSQRLDYSCMALCPISDNSGKFCCSEYYKQDSFDTKKEEHANAQTFLDRIAKINIAKAVQKYNSYLKGLEND